MLKKHTTNNGICEIHTVVIKKTRLLFNVEEIKKVINFMKSDY